MSIILKGVDIHEKFESARLILERNEKDGTIRVINESSGEYIGQAIQIPTPHGRIIDEKELLDKIKRGLYSEDINQVIYSVGAEDIANAPTILDEEGE